MFSIRCFLILMHSFLFQGLRGIREHDPKKLWFFYLWKLGRFCFESLLLFTDMFEAPRYPESSEQDSLNSFLR